MNKDAVSLVGVWTEDFSGKRIKYGVSDQNAVKDKIVFKSVGGERAVTVTDNSENGIFAESERVKKCSLTFKIKDKGATFLVHNQAVDDFRESGIYTDGSGKSTYFLCVKNGKDYISFGNALPCKFNAHFFYGKKGGYIYVDFVTEYPATYNGAFRTEKLFVSRKEPIAALKEFIKEDKHDFEKPVGWSTWDYYFTDINEDCVRENTDFIANDKVLSKTVKYIAIDDGWEHREGDWKEGATFPNGLKKTAGYITKKGFKAGIWVCPVRLNTLCATVMRRNAFLVRNEYGDPVIYDGFYVLDPTHPDGEKYLRETFTYLKSCGFAFYKIDFIGHLLAGERFYDVSAGPYDAIRRLLTIIRECVGNSHILGCNMPYGVGSGYVDSRRVGLDIHNTFGHIIKCGEIFLPQFAAQERIYRNDLDYLVVRGEETSEKDEYNVLNPTAGYWKTHAAENFVWRGGKDFSYTEAKIWCALELVSGSSLFLGDRLSKLNEKGLKLVYTVLENADFVGGEPVDAFETPLPSVWKKQGAVALFNFGKEKKTEVIADLTAKEYTDIFTEKTYKPQNGRLKITLSSRDCVYLKEKE